MPSFSVNILSIQKLIEKGFIINFITETDKLQRKTLVLESKLLANIYFLNIIHKVVISNLKRTSKSYILYNKYNKHILERIKLYYKHFRHKNISTICKLLNV